MTLRMRGAVRRTPLLGECGVSTFHPCRLTSPHSEARHTDETADKLDCMMDTVFSYLARCDKAGACLSRPRFITRPFLSRILAGEFESTMHTLLRALQSSLLTTYKSKFTQVRSSATLPIHTAHTRAQFLLFYACSKDESLSTSAAFCQLLVRRRQHLCLLLALTTLPCRRRRWPMQCLLPSCALLPHPTLRASWFASLPAP